MNYVYKCVVARNGSKQYYKSVGGKWKRVSNKSGMKAEKGKRKYGAPTKKPVAPGTENRPVCDCRLDPDLPRKGQFGWCAIRNKTGALESQRPVCDW